MTTYYKDQNTALDIAISHLEAEKRKKLQELKWQFELTMNSMRPMNIIKDTFQDMRASPEVKASFVTTAASLTGGYLSKKLLFGKSKSLFKTVIGYALQYGVSKFIAKKVTPNV